MFTKKFSAKILATILTLALLTTAFAISPDVFSASAASSEGQYYLYLDVNVTESALTNKLYFNITYKTANGMGSELSTSTSSEDKNLDAGHYAKGMWLDGWPTSVSFHYNCAYINHSLTYSATAYVNTTGESGGTVIGKIEEKSVKDGASNVQSTDPFTMNTGMEPYPANISFSSDSNSIALDGISDKSVSLSTSATDQYGVPMLSENFISMEITKCAYSADEISLLGKNELITNLVATKDAHILATGVNSQEVTVTSKWNGSKQNSKSLNIRIDDEKCTPSFKYYSTNTSNLAKPDSQVINGTETYYGEIPVVPIVVAANTSYYTAVNHYVDGKFSLTPITGATIYTMEYTQGAHNFTVSTIEAATCTSGGTNKLVCECGYTKTEAVPALDHNYASSVVPATCTEKGYTKYTCLRCGDTYNSMYVDAYGHNYVTSVVPATCTEKGYTLHKCSRCDSAYSNNYTTELGHNYLANILKEPTCTTDGLKQLTCSRCGDNYTEEIIAKGHTYKTTVVEPTCEKGGYTTYYCTTCADTYTGDVTPALGHDKVIYNSAPLDQTDGVFYCQCTRCKKYYSATTDSNGDTVAGTTAYMTLSDAKRASSEIPAPSFNMYTDPSGYKYVSRGASLKLDDGEYTDTNTVQKMRFTSSVLLPNGTDYSFTSSSHNAMVDFGFVYSQSELIGGNMGNLAIGKNNVYKMSVKDKNSGSFNGHNWGGVTAHETDSGTVLTFNLVIGVKALNWSSDYCARAYVQYNYSGFVFTVYDYSYSTRNVVAIAKKIVANPNESVECKDYINSKILNNI